MPSVHASGLEQCLSCFAVTEMLHNKSFMIADRTFDNDAASTSEDKYESVGSQVETHGFYFSVVVGQEWVPMSALGNCMPAA